MNTGLFFIILGSLPPYPLDMYKYKKNRGAFIQTTLLGSQEYLMRVIKRTRPQYFQSYRQKYSTRNTLARLTKTSIPIGFNPYGHGNPHSGIHVVPRDVHPDA
jgi:hypothetical protein